MNIVVEIIVVLEFFGGLILIYGLGCLVGHLLKLDNHLNENKKTTKGLTSDIDRFF